MISSSNLKLEYIYFQSFIYWYTKIRGFSHSNKLCLCDYVFRLLNHSIWWECNNIIGHFVCHYLFRHKQITLSSRNIVHLTKRQRYITHSEPFFFLPNNETYTFHCSFLSLRSFGLYPWAEVYCPQGVN